MVDIHNAKERIEWSKKSITQRFSKNNAQMSCRFLTRLRLENKSYGRVANYADCCIRILKLKDDQNIQDWTRDNIEYVHQLVADSDHEQFDKSKLDRLIVSKNNRLNFRDYDPKKNFGYQVTCVEPTDYSQITKDTVVEFVTINSDVIHSFFGKIKLEKLQNVVPIVYQETLNNVDVIIPSLEIFDTGIRFYLYLKSNFDQHKVIPQGSASVVVTLNDDLGNSYDLGSHGGGGSHSPQGFDYRYEFHGKQLHSDAKHLTIMLHEILIQERFPREDPGSSFSRRPMMGTKDEYANVDKFPSFFIISGPWKSTFSLNRNQSN